MKTILFMPTMLCNLKCPICHFKVSRTPSSYNFFGWGFDHIIEKEIEWQEWLKHFNRFRPYCLEITGGEPTMYKGFRELISHLPEEATWNMTSNIVNGSMEGVTLSKCKNWTASYHFENKSLFIKNLNYLKPRVKVCVTIVAEFNDFKKTIDAAIEFSRHVKQVNILRQLGKGIDWRNSEQEKVLDVMRTKGFNIVDVDMPSSYNFESGYSCLAGVDYLCAMPDGKVYDCYSKAMQNKDGVFMSEYNTRHSIYDCHNVCYGCASDNKFRTRKLKGVAA
jgi:organic radical activating enzyme